MLLGQEARVTVADGPGVTRFVDSPRQCRFGGLPCDSQSVDTPDEGRP